MSAMDEAAKAAGVAKEIIQIAKDDPDARQAGRNIAESLVIVTQTVKTVLLPLAAVNYGIARAQNYFQTRFGDDLGEKLQSIPPENLAEPKASLAGPTLQGIAFSFDEEELKNLYLELLATAMNSRAAGAAHPAFVQIIRELSAEEVRLLSRVLEQGADGSIKAIAEYRFVDPINGGWRTAERHQIGLRQRGEPAFNSRLASWVDNWIRLGLINVSYDTWLSDSEVEGPSPYAWVESSPLYIELASQKNEGHNLEFAKGTLEVTAFGLLFAKSVGIVQDEN